MPYTLEERYQLIREAVMESRSVDPVAVAQEAMRRDFVSIHGPEHHFLDGAAFLVAFRNAGGKIDLGPALDELAARALKMPGAMCGFWGMCGSTASVGAALAIIDGTGPLSQDESYKEHMEYTSSVIKRMSIIGGPRCCKRNAFLSLSSAVEFANKRYGVPMKCSPITCEFSPYNPTCLKEACPFFSKKGI